MTDEDEDFDWPDDAAEDVATQDEQLDDADPDDLSDEGETEAHDALKPEGGDQ